MLQRLAENRWYRTGVGALIDVATAFAYAGVLYLAALQMSDVGQHLIWQLTAAGFVLLIAATTARRLSKRVLLSGVPRTLGEQVTGDYVSLVVLWTAALLLGGASPYAFGALVATVVFLAGALPTVRMTSDRWPVAIVAAAVVWIVWLFAFGHWTAGLSPEALQIKAGVIEGVGAIATAWLLLLMALAFIDGIRRMVDQYSANNRLGQRF